MSLSSAEYEAKRAQIKEAIRQLEDDLEKLHIEMCGSKKEYQRQLWMHYISCPNIE